MNEVLLKNFEKLKQELVNLGFELNMSFEEYENPELMGYEKRTLRIKCDQGHVFYRKLDNWRNRKDCSACFDRNNKSGVFIEKMKLNNWTYVSGEYKNKSSVLTANCDLCGDTETKQFRAFRDKQHPCQKQRSLALRGS